MNLTRRTFLGFGTTLASGASVGFSLLHARKAAAVGFGPLLDDPAAVIDLPAGFGYQVLQNAGDSMSDGRAVRGAPDGMAAFPGANPGQVILMRNHELTVDGGVSRLVLDTTDVRELLLLSSNDVLGGTIRNCAGGPSPWGWLSCEEQALGGVWLCPLTAESLLQGNERVRIDVYGSFRHEAVAVDPDTLIAYLTEDDGNSFLYRFAPSNVKVKGPFEGKLQAMKHVDVADFNTALMSPGESIEIEWVDVSAATPRADAQSQAATVIVRGEGIWWFDGVVYFAATSNGQIFELVPNAKNTGGTLRLLADALNGPDNVTVAPWGDLFVAEDNGFANHLRIVDRDGAVSEFARNRAAATTEFAGVCFSPDGAILFVNLYGPGMTLAITGPFPGAPVPPGGWGGGGGGGGAGGSDETSAGGDDGGRSAGAGGEPQHGDSGNGGRTAGPEGGSPSAGAGAAGDSPDQKLIAGGGCACTAPAARPSALGELVALGGAAAVSVARRGRRSSDP